MKLDHTTGIGDALGDHYVIERLLGAGGMATVYLADDLKHHRKVAIKVLKPEVAATIGPERFLREIETAARLNHPHIMPLYDSGAVGAILYFVMPYVRGETLRQRITREKRLPIDVALNITRQVGAALSFAHSEGVVHRDIKPENILIHEGEAMVADFGIALAMESAADRLTGTGIYIGTPEYMSPEQSVGESAVDARSDVYSLACVLYELLTGELPHTGPTAMAIIAKRMTGPAPTVRRLRSEVPARVERALMRALALNPADRFDSVAAFAAALTESDVGQPRLPSVAVLPFVNLSADPENEYFADGMTEDVIAQLSKIRALKVISRTSVMQFKKRDKSLREIGAALEATTLLEGSVRRAGDRVRIVAQLIDAAADQHLWAETYDRQMTDLFAIQSDVAVQIAAALRAELSQEEKARLRKEPTRDLEAYQLYLQGRHYYIRYTEEGMRRGIEYYERAIAKDPEFAMAYVGVSLAYTELGEIGALRLDEACRGGKEAALRALALDNELGEAHCALAHVTFVGEFDWVGAERGFKRSLELKPSHADAYDLYGRLCSALARHDEAIAMQNRAQELDPLAHRADVATAYLRAGQYDEALRRAMHAIEVDPVYARGHATAAWALALKGQVDKGIAALQRAVALAPDETAWLGQLGQMYGMAGEIDKARAVLQQLQALSASRYVSAYHFAYVHTGLGEHDLAMDYLERAYADRSGAIYGIKGSFLFTSLHSNPRFTALLRKMNLA